LKRPHNELRPATQLALEALEEAPPTTQLEPEITAERTSEEVSVLGSDEPSDLLGLPQTGEAARRSVSERGRREPVGGRPRGLHNRKTEYWIAYLTSRYASPLEVLAQLATAPVDTLARELGCSRLAALQEKRHAAEALAPYLHQRLAQIELRPPGEPGGAPVPLQALAALNLSAEQQVEPTDIDAVDITPLTAGNPEQS
jgi:hypothetical protein